MTRFFAKPMVFDIVNKVKRSEVLTAHMGVTSRLPVTSRRLDKRSHKLFRKFVQGYVLFRRTDDTTLHDARVNHNLLETTYLLVCVTQRKYFLKG